MSVYQGYTLVVTNTDKPLHELYGKTVRIEHAENGQIGATLIEKKPKLPCMAVRRMLKGMAAKKKGAKKRAKRK